MDSRSWVLVSLVMVVSVTCVGCKDDDGGNEDTRPQAGSSGGDSDAGHSGSGMDGNAGDNPETTRAMVTAWVEDFIAAFDRTIAASCACLVSSQSFASTEDCLAALGSGPDWLECSLRAFDAADGGLVLEADRAQCLIENSDARGACLEQAGCDADAMTGCLDMPGPHPDCASLANDVVLYLLEQCPDLGLLSR